VRVDHEAARFQRSRRVLGQITILKHSAAQHDLFQFGTRGHFHNPRDQRVMEPSRIIHIVNEETMVRVANYVYSADPTMADMIIDRLAR